MRGSLRTRAPRETAVPATILVVDDDAGIRDTVALILTAEGYHVRTAADGAEALQLAAADPPDVVVLDLILPTLDGRATCARLRERSGGPRVIIMTAGRRAAREARALRADGFLKKPFDVGELLALIGRWVPTAARQVSPHRRPLP
jgi:DNA-binding response OmpR family regulator